MSKHSDFLEAAHDAAVAAGHLYPEIAACEAALESAWGESKLAREANNLFGRKAGKAWAGEVVILPTDEFIDGKTVHIPNERWAKFSSWIECFRDRMNVLERLAPKFPHYAAALGAQTAEDFVREVSATWSTDPKRAEKVLAIHREHMGLQ